jgi:hypothetical protein
MSYYNDKERSRTMSAFNSYRPIMERAYADGRAFSKGRFWYQMNGARIERAAKQNGVPVQSAVAMCSALSPLTPWERNFDGTLDLLENVQRETRSELIERATEHTVFNSNARTGVDLMLGNVDPIDALSGPKVWHFYQNLMGDLDNYITVDSWMYKLANKFGLSTNTPTDNAIRSIRRSLRMLGTMWGLEPAQVQAVVWVQSRNYEQQ